MDANVIVTEEIIPDVIEEINQAAIVAVDTETTGLYPFKNDKLFSIQISTPQRSFYFNFNWYSELGVEKYQLKDASRLKPIFDKPRLWVLQNAKFDLHFLNKAGLMPQGEYYDTEVGGRILNNVHKSYSLDNQAERHLGERKDPKVMEWLDANKCYTMVQVPGRKQPDKNYHFDQVPFELITSYGMKDTWLTHKLYEYQLHNYAESDIPVIDQEMRLIETLFHMEQTGVQLNVDYAKQAAEFDDLKRYEALKEFKEITGQELTDSGEFLKPFFESLGYSIPFTFKGEPNVDSDVVSGIDHPSARALEKYRDAEKRYSTFMGLINAADSKGVVHTDFRQSGTVTGRMSSRNPNLQNLQAEDENRFPIRRAFVPRPGFFFVSIDYQQMEFRLLLEYAGEMELIEKIKAGHDPHQATADLTGLDRKAAKTLNFGLVYGMGIAKLGKAIGVNDARAKEFKRQYFASLPGVRNFLYNSADRQKLRGFTWNWMGRRFVLEDPKWSYRAANSIIQGGCADVCKKAMNALYLYLKDKASRMVLQVHDEILFEVAFDEVEIIGMLKQTMDMAYPAKNMPLTTSVSFSLESFHDMIEVDDIREIEEQIAGKGISGKSTETLKAAAEHLVL